MLCVGTGKEQYRTQANVVPRRGPESVNAAIKVLEFAAASRVQLLVACCKFGYVVRSKSGIYIFLSSSWEAICAGSGVTGNAMGYAFWEDSGCLGLGIGSFRAIK